MQLRGTWESCAEATPGDGEHRPAISGGLSSSSGVGPEDFVNRATRNRGDEQVSVRPGLDARDNTPVRAEQQAFAFGDVVLGEVVGHAIEESRVVHGDVLTIAREPVPSTTSPK